MLGLEPSISRWRTPAQRSSHEADPRHVRTEFFTSPQPRPNLLQQQLQRPHHLIRRNHRAKLSSARMPSIQADPANPTTAPHRLRRSNHNLIRITASYVSDFTSASSAGAARSAILPIAKPISHTRHRAIMRLGLRFLVRLRDMQSQAQMHLALPLMAGRHVRLSIRMQIGRQPASDRCGPPRTADSPERPTPETCPPTRRRCGSAGAAFETAAAPNEHDRNDGTRRETKKPPVSRRVSARPAFRKIAPDFQNMARRTPRKPADCRCGHPINNLPR